VIVFNIKNGQLRGKVLGKEKRESGEGAGGGEGVKERKLGEKYGG